MLLLNKLDLDAFRRHVNLNHFYYTATNALVECPGKHEQTNCSTVGELVKLSFKCNKLNNTDRRMKELLESNMNKEETPMYG